MELLAIICEYNPFHTGHARLISEARERVHPDGVVGLMSGWFVQRAEPAVLPPLLRAKTALTCGTDAVLQMPVCHSVAAAPDFAGNAVKTLASVPQIRYLAFGAEDDERLLRAVASVKVSEPPAFKEALRAALDCGEGYATAMASAVCAAMKDDSIPKEDIRAALNKPNNILAIEYLTAIQKYAPHISPVIVKRNDGGYHSQETGGAFISATAARALLSKGEWEKLTPYLPQETLSECIAAYQNHPINARTLEALTIYALRTQNPSACPDDGEGLGHRLRENAKKYGTLEDIVTYTANKRYTNARIKRICLQTLLGITERIAFPTAKPIAIKRSAETLLPLFAHFSTRNRDYHKTEALRKIAAIEQRAADIFALVTNRQGNEFTDERLYMPKD